MTIKIRIGQTEKSFKTNKEVMSFLARQAGGKTLRFQRFVFNSRGGLEEMDYLTYRQGRISETYNTRR